MEHFQLEEQDLLKRVEQLRAKAAEIKKNNEENKISQQRDLITENFRKFTEMCDLSEESIWAFINSVFPYQQYKKYLQADPKAPFIGERKPNTHINTQLLNVGFYTKASDRNILLERILINYFAKYHQIRFEDSKDVLVDFIISMRPINLNGQQYVKSDFVPLFF